jgi:hypothetical protein
MQRAAGRFGSFPKGGETVEKEFTESFDLSDNIFIICIFLGNRSKLAAPTSIRRLI